MAKVDFDDGARLARIGERQSPELLFDASLIAAMEAKGDGAYAMHLAGGQSIQLRPSVAAGVLKKLTARSQKPEVRSQESGELVKQKRRRRAAPRPSLLASFGGYLSRLLD